MFNFIVMNNFLWTSSIIMAVIGACFGSFAALIIVRLKQGTSIVTPRSHCDFCGKTLKIKHLIPIFSWLFLGGKCGFCRKPIGLRPLVIELILAVGLTALYLKFGISLALFERFIFLFLLLCLAYCDLDTYTLPAGLLFLLLLVGMVMSVIYFFHPHLFLTPSKPLSLLNQMVFFRPRAFSLSDRLLGGSLGFLSFSLVNVISTFILRKTGRLSPQQWAMGFGDPLLLMGIGLFVGASHLVLVIFLSSALGSLCGLMGRFIKQVPDGEIAQGALPYGPFLAIAAIYVYLW